MTKASGKHAKTNANNSSVAEEAQRIIESASDEAERTQALESIGIPVVDTLAGAGPADAGAGSVSGAAGAGAGAPTSALPVIGPASAVAGTPFVVEKKKRSFAPLIAVLVILGLIAAVYLGGAFYFGRHAYPNTIMGTADVSMKSQDQIAEIIDAIVGNYTVTTTGDGAHFAFAMKDAGVQIDSQGIAGAAIDTYSRWEWPLELNKTHDVTHVMTNTVNASGLEKLVVDTVNSFNEDGTDPVNASIVYDSEAKAYIVEPEKPGTKLDAQKVLAVVNDAVSNMSETATLDEDAYIKAAITQDDPKLREAADIASGYVRASIDLVLGTDAIPAGTVNADQISQWVILGEDNNVGFNEEAMNKWLTDFGNSFDTVGTERTYTRPDGAVFTVSGGTYGWEVDTPALVEAVRGAIVEGATTTITIPTLKEAATYPAEKGIADWGKYVDVSIGEQHARCYDVDGKLLWESDFVSGSPDGKHDTPYGIYQLFNKESPSVLKGEIQEDTNKPEYETEVQFWMAFTFQGHGFHDATWQPEFGGTRYADGWGSHGCVNLPYDKAEELYGIIDVGNAVVIHG